MRMTDASLFLMAPSAVAAIGARIKRARLKKGLNQAALAELVGKQQTTISYWEGGHRSPDLDDIIALADALDVDIAYFFDRIETRTPKKVLLRAEATLRPYGELAEELEVFAAKAEGMDPVVPQVHITAQAPIPAAQQLLAQARVAKPPVDVDELSHLCGLNVAAAELSNDVSGVLLDLDTGPVIGFNKDHALTRQRFTVAHELGHYLLNHHDHFHIDLSDLESLGEVPGYNWQDERAANEFAAELLMPAALVAAHFNGDLAELAHTFKVSSQAMDGAYSIWAFCISFLAMRFVSWSEPETVRDDLRLGAEKLGFSRRCRWRAGSATDSPMAPVPQGAVGRFLVREKLVPTSMIWAVA